MGMLQEYNITPQSDNENNPKFMWTDQPISISVSKVKVVVELVQTTLYKTLSISMFVFPAYHFHVVVHNSVLAGAVASSSSSFFMLFMLLMFLLLIVGWSFVTMDDTNWPVAKTNWSAIATDIPVPLLL
jgi:hypothetical protein